MPDITFGPWRPDVVGVDRNIMNDVTNVVSTPGGFRPVGALASFTDMLPTTPCIGSASFLDVTGSGITFAGSPTNLYKLDPNGTWVDVTRASGPYNTAEGESWKFAQFNNLDGNFGVATNFSDKIQYIDLDDPLAVFQDLASINDAPPHARHLAVVGNFLVLGNLSDGELQPVLEPQAIQWSGLNRISDWTPGVNSSGKQNFPDGGPVNDIIGGDVGWILQFQSIRRQIFTPASDLIFQIDKIEDERGLLAPNGAVRVGNEIYMVDREGFFIFDPGTGRTRSIGADKVDVFFNGNKRVNTNLLIISAFDPISHFVFWGYVSVDNTGDTPDRLMIYNWTTKEWSKANVNATAFTQYVTSRVSLDGLDPFGNMETLSFSLDSPVWSGGASILGIFGTDGRMSNLSGPALEAKFETPDAQLIDNQLSFISGITPTIEADEVFVSVGHRQKLSDSIVFNPETGAESTGQCPAHASGRYVRAKIRVPAGQIWRLAQGFDVTINQDGSR